MDPNLQGTYYGEITSGYDFVPVGQFVGAGDIVRTSAEGQLFKRVIRDAEANGSFASVKMVIRDPAQIPLDSLSRYVQRAILGNSAPVESFVAINPDYAASTADPADVDTVGRKIAVLLECPYGPDEA